MGRVCDRGDAAIGAGAPAARSGRHIAEAVPRRRVENVIITPPLDSARIPTRQWPVFMQPAHGLSERNRVADRLALVVLMGLLGSGRCRGQELALLWQIFGGAGFPNQFFCDSWVVGFWRGRP